MDTVAQVVAQGAPGLERLRYRRQFVLGPRFLDDPPGWRRVEVTPRLRLTVHPDLPVAHVAEGDRSVTVLGVLLDPARPEAGDADLARALLASGAPPRGLWARTDGWGGRFALLARHGDEAVLFHDACGLRQVHWAAVGGETWCASQPGLLARELGLARDPEALAFMASRGDDDGAVYWMPGDRSMYREIRCLLPNHLLDLGAGAARRFWPGVDPLPPARDPAAAVPAAVEEAARVLSGVVAAARRRGPLAVPMTAGWDSRLMLALSRDLAGEATCFTLTYPGAPAGARDVSVPARLLARLGVPHRIIPYPTEVDEPFKAVLRASADAVKAGACGDVQAMRAALPDGLTCLTGDVAEIVKCFWRLPGKAEAEVTAEDLGALSLVGSHPYARRAFQDWLDAAPRGAVPLLDLFCWEQMAGRWQAQIRSDYDLVQEAIAPLDVRALLARLLAVDEGARRAPAFPLFRALIERLWPAVLAEPINPPERLTARAAVGRVLRRLGLLDLVKRALGRA